MFRKTNWGWVREWTGRIFATAFLLLTFAFLASGNVVRPGGVIEALPTVMLYAFAAAIPITAGAALVLAVLSHRKGGRHE